MIEAFAPNGTNHPLHVRPLPRRARSGQHFMDAYVSHLFSEFKAEDSITVAQQVTRELVKGKGLPQLLSCPLGSRVGGHIEVQNATPVVGQYQKHESTWKRMVGTVKKSIETIWVRWFSRKVRQV